MSDEKKPKEPTEYGKKLQAMSAAFMDVVNKEFPGTTIDEIRMALGLTLSTTHTVMFATAKTPADIETAKNAVFDSFQRMGNSMNHTAEMFKIDDFYVESGSVDMPTNPADIN